MFNALCKFLCERGQSKISSVNKDDLFRICKVYPCLVSASAIIFQVECLPHQRHPLHIEKSSSIFLLDANTALASRHPEAEWIRSTVVTSLRRRYRSFNRVLQQKAPKSSSTRFGGVFVPKLVKSRLHHRRCSVRKKAYVSRHKNRNGISDTVCRLPRCFGAVSDVYNCNWG